MAACTLEEPGCDALKVHVPVDTSVTVSPAYVQTEVVVDVTVTVSLGASVVAMARNDDVLKVLFVIASNVRVCVGRSVE